MHTDAGKAPRAFAEYPIPKGEFPLLAAESLPSGSLKANPKKVTEQDVIHLLEQVTG